jgi:hypothetical protein
MQSSLKRMRIVTAAAVMITALAALPALAGDWKYDAALYGWFSGLSGTIGVGRAGNLPVEASFSDLNGYLDFSLAGHFEARNPKYVLLADIFYVNLGAERDVEIRRQTVKVNMDYTQWIMELGGGYRLSENFDVLLAGRYYIFDLGTTASAITGDKRSESLHNWGDVFVGGRFHTVLGEKWILSLRGDVGVGGSDLALFGNAAVGYQFTKLVSLGLDYQVLSLDYETGAGEDYFKYDVTTDGVGLMANFSF